MAFYETTYILHSALQEGRLSDIVNAIEKKTTSLGAEILFKENWGRKKLSYLIDKEKYGTYIYFQFKIKEAKDLKELTSEFQHNPNILRHLTIQIEERDIKEQPEKNDKTQDGEERTKDKNISDKKVDDVQEEIKSEKKSEKPKEELLEKDKLDKE
jgi:small subunit ribosomal protein S6